MSACKKSNGHGTLCEELDHWSPARCTTNDWAYKAGIVLPEYKYSEPFTMPAPNQPEEASAAGGLATPVVDSAKVSHGKGAIFTLFLKSCFFLFICFFFILSLFILILIFLLIFCFGCSRSCGPHIRLWCDDGGFAASESYQISSKLKGAGKKNI